MLLKLCSIAIYEHLIIIFLMQFLVWHIYCTYYSLKMREVFGFNKTKLKKKGVVFFFLGGEGGLGGVGLCGGSGLEDTKLIEVEQALIPFVYIK